MFARLVFSFFFLFFLFFVFISLSRLARAKMARRLDLHAGGREEGRASAVAVSRHDFPSFIQ
jgi:hypothetical protein